MGHSRTFERLLAVLTVAGSLFTALLLASALPDRELHNSDILYAPSFFDDLWRGIDVSGWALTPAPYFFPDLLLYGLFDALMRLAGSDNATRIDLALRFTAAFYYLLNGTGFAVLLKRMYRVGYQQGLLLWTFISLCFMLVPGFSASFLGAHVPTNHSGLLPVVLLFWILWSPAYRVRSRVWVSRLLALLLLLVTLISDRQMLVLAVAPAAAVALIGLIFPGGKGGHTVTGPSTDRARHVLDLTLLLAALFLSMRIVARIRDSVVFFPPLAGMKTVLYGALEAGWPALWQVMQTEGFALSMLTLIVSALLLLLRRNNDPATRSGLLLAGIGGLTSALLLQMALAPDDGPVAPIPGRYLHFLFVLLVPFACAALLLPVWGFASRRGGLPILLLLTVLPFAMPYLRPDAFSVAALPARGRNAAVMKEVQCVRSLVEKHGGGPLYGIADYWPAKRLSLFSEGQVRLLPVHPDRADMLLFWITNLSWFGGEDRQYRFAVLNGLDRENVESLYGRPLAVQRCAGLELWWYEEGVLQFPAEQMRLFAKAVGVPWAGK